MNNNSKLENIQIMRTIAALMVMSAHLISDAIKYNRTPVEIGIIRTFLLKGVDIFFFISGFIITLLYIKQHDNIKTFLKKRIIRIFPSYYIFTLPAFLIWLIKPSLFNNAANNKTDIISSFLLLPAENGYLHLLPVTWTLCFEIWFYIFFTFCIFVSKKRIFIPISVYVIYLFFISLSTKFNFLTIENRYLALLNSPYCLEFLAGCLFCFTYSFRNLKLIFFLLLSMLSLGIFNINMFLMTLISIILFIGFELYNKYFSFNKMVMLLGDSSYSLYLSHLLVMGLIKHTVSKLEISLIYIPDFVWIGAMILIPLIFSIIYYLKIEKPLTQYLRRRFM